MAISARKFSELVERIAPLSCAYDWDNSGLTLYQHDHVERVFVCLDITPETLQEAAERGCDTVLSHHPLLFSAQKKFSCAAPVDQLFLQAVRAGFNLYAAHTSYDCAPGGLNEHLAKLLGLEERRSLVAQNWDEQGEMASGIGVIGAYEAALSPAEFAEKVKKALDLPGLRMADSGRKIRRVACVGGAGSEFLAEAAKAGADAFLTGEVKHNYYAEAQVLGMTLVEAGHYDTEKIFVRAMREGLQNAQNELNSKIEVMCPQRKKRSYEFC